mmetsp:Transcript_40150/g.96143  ORF Transcript_40150/g.96143 Transcript_40150/m.96143 type:complete len:217 (+) Transcript_40150:1949-2599(+)
MLLLLLLSRRSRGFLGRRRPLLACRALRRALRRWLRPLGLGSGRLARGRRPLRLHRHMLPLDGGEVLAALALRVVLHEEVELTRGRLHDAGVPRLAPVPVDLHALPDPGRPCWWRRRHRWARRCWARGDRSAVGLAEAAPDRRALRHRRLLRAGGRFDGRRPALPARRAARAVGVDVVTHLRALAGGRRAQEVRAESRRIELRAVRSQLVDAASGS